MTPRAEPIGLTRRSRAVLLAALLVASAGSSVMYTVLPAFAERTGLAATATGALMTTSGLFYALGAPVWGRYSDRWGRGRVLALGLLGYGMVFLAFAAVGQLGLAGMLTGTMLLLALLLTRPVGGVLAAAVPPVVQAAIADRTNAQQRAAGMALIGTASGLGLLLGPALGALGGLLGTLTPVWVVGAVAVLLALAVPAVLPEAPSDGTVGRSGSGLRPTDLRVLPWLAANFVVFTVFAVLAATTGYLVHDRYGGTAAQITGQTGLYLMLLGVGLVGAQAAVGRRRGGPGNLLALGGLLAASGVAGYGWAPELVILLGAALLQGAGIGLILPGLLAAASLAVGAGEQGSLGGLLTFAQAIGFAVGPLAGGLAYDHSPALFPPLGTVAFLVVGATGWWWSRRPPP